MKKFIGYYIIGANTIQEAKDKKGLVLWSQKRPHALHRYFLRRLLSIYWIDETKELAEKTVSTLKEGVHTESKRFYTPKNSKKTA